LDSQHSLGEHAQEQADALLLTDAHAEVFIMMKCAVLAQKGTVDVDADPQYALVAWLGVHSFAEEMVFALLLTLVAATSVGQVKNASQEPQ